MTKGVPLIIPEVNPEDIGSLKAGHGGIIANPNCSTIIALMAATPIHRAVGIKRMVISTYQVRPLHTMRFGSTAKVLAEFKLEYYRIPDSFSLQSVSLQTRQDGHQASAPL